MIRSGCLVVLLLSAPAGIAEEPADNAVPSLLEAIRVGNETERSDALEVLRRSEAKRKEANDELWTIFLSQREPHGIREAVFLLIIEPVDKQRLADLQRILRDKSEPTGVRLSAIAGVQLIARDWPKETQAASSLLQLFVAADDLLELRQSACLSIASLSAVKEEAERAITEVLRRKSEPIDLRLTAAESLPLLTISPTEERNVAESLPRVTISDTAERLVSVRPDARALERYILVLLAIAQDKSEPLSLRLRVLESVFAINLTSLVFLAPVSRVQPAAQAWLIEALANPQEPKRLREACGRALASFWGTEKELAPRLIRILKANDPISREYVAEALGKLGSHARDAVPLLLRLYNDQAIGESSNQIAARALWEIDEVAAKGAGIDFDDASR